MKNACALKYIEKKGKRGKESCEVSN
jgi:hypothetical protein